MTEEQGKNLSTFFQTLSELQSSSSFTNNTTTTLLQSNNNAEQPPSTTNVVNTSEHQQQGSIISPTNDSTSSSSTTTTTTTIDNNFLIESKIFNELLNKISFDQINILNSILTTISLNEEMINNFNWNELYYFILFKIHLFCNDNNFIKENNLKEIIQSIEEHFKKFKNSPPFTLQRLCELLSQPNKHYKRLKHLLCSIEKCVNVNSYLSDFIEIHHSTINNNNTNNSGSDNRRHVTFSVSFGQEDIINENSQQLLEENDVTMQDVI